MTKVCNPLILRLPRVGSPHHQSRQADDPLRQVDQVVELRDLLPTFCDLAGCDTPAHVDGRSILPLARGETGGWREYLHGEHFLQQDSNQWLTDGREKYVWFSQTGRELLFDLEEDPTELRDLSTARPQRAAFWRERLMAELDGREEGFVQNGKLVSGMPQSPTLVNAGQYRER